MKAIIDPDPVRVRLQRRARLLVAVPQRKLPKLSPETVEQTRARLLKDRNGGK